MRSHGQKDGTRRTGALGLVKKHMWWLAIRKKNPIASTGNARDAVMVRAPAFGEQSGAMDSKASHRLKPCSLRYKALHLLGTSMAGVVF